jgi:hypothetical protein
VMMMTMMMMIFDEKDEFWAVRRCPAIQKAYRRRPFELCWWIYHSKHGCEPALPFCSYYAVLAVMSRCQFAEVVPNA